MGGVKTIDMRAHGTQKTKTKAMCYKQKHKHMASKTNQQPCAKQDSYAANENTYKPCVLTRHDNMKARSQWKTQDITWMHAACKNTRWQEKHATDTWTEECAAEQTRDCTATQQDRTWSVSIRTPTRNRNSRHECQDSKTTLQYETRHADKRVHGLSTLEAAHSHENKTWRECQGSVTKPWITLDRWDRTLTDWSTVETLLIIS